MGVNGTLHCTALHCSAMQCSAKPLYALKHRRYPKLKKIWTCLAHILQQKISDLKEHILDKNYICVKCSERSAVTPSAWDCGKASNSKLCINYIQTWANTLENLQFYTAGLIISVFNATLVKLITIGCIEVLPAIALLRNQIVVVLSDRIQESTIFWAKLIKTWEQN